jgi:DNA mismatch repair protein MutS2
MEFTSDYELVVKLLSQTAEMRNILIDEVSFPSQDYYDLTPELHRVRPEGTFIEAELLPELRLSLLTISQLISFFTGRDDGKYPVLCKLTEPVSIDPGIVKELNRILNERGMIADHASPKLAEIRKDIIRKTFQAQRKLNEMLAFAKKSGWTAEDTEPGIRNGRLVIPVSAGNKRKIRGFIHDESATGQTAYVEPEEVFEINNDIRELENDERREIVRILIMFTAFLRPSLETLHQAYQYLGIVDFIRAKARLALKINAHKPLLNNKPLIGWLDAVHPLLYLSLRAQKKEVVPLQISLDKNQRILIISGPNAGGKSVCLKTLGLVQYMLQCGMLVPLRPTSETGIFSDIFIDIGDEQSLENDLSTYSSHLLNMKFFMANARHHTLFLIDELGTGTEPRLGGAIAEAMIEKLSHRKAFGVITTHYANLKLLAGKVDGVINGAMLFDTRFMQPLFRLRIGKPGSSFAFEIARKMGLPDDVLKNAAEKSGETQLSFDQQLQQLELEKNELDKKRVELTVADQLLTDTLTKYQNLYNKLEKDKKDVLKTAREQAAQVVKGANKLIENTIQEIRKAQAEKEATRKLRDGLKKEEEVLQLEAETEHPQEISLVPEPKPEVQPEPEDKTIRPGDAVKIKGQEAVGEVVSVKNEDVVVSFNSVTLNTTLNRLKKVSRSEIRQTERKRYTGSIAEQINEKIAHFNLTVDVRGKKVEEALSRVDHYMDEALLLGIREVRILHGKGDGVLRTVIREKLMTISSVSSYKDERLEQGGAGITVVMMK